jgi:hypothetical protein
MIKNTTLKDNSKLRAESPPNMVTKTLLKPSGLTMKFILGYAAALEVLQTTLIGNLDVINN